MRVSIKQLAARQWPVPVIEWDESVPADHREAIATVLSEYVEPLKSTDPEGPYRVGTTLCIACEQELRVRWGIVHGARECGSCGYPVVTIAAPLGNQWVRITNWDYQPHPRTLLPAEDRA